MTVNDSLTFLFYKGLAVLVCSVLVSCSHSVPEPEPTEETTRIHVTLPAVPAQKKKSETVPPNLSSQAKEASPQHIRPNRIKQLFSVSSQKEQAPEVDSAEIPQETVEIGGKIYPIPLPWTGKKLPVPVLTNDSLVQIPVEHVHGNREVYVKKEAYGPLLKMIDAAASEGVCLLVETAYRDIESQKKIFLRKFEEGRTWADIVRYVAPPGYSEHMLGLAIDFYPSGWQFASTKGYRWLQKHADKYGFIESYPRVRLPGHSKIAWEAWHWLYTGKENWKQQNR